MRARPLLLATALLAASTAARGRAFADDAGPADQPAASLDGPLRELPYTPSLDVPSMDRSVDPCVDFYAYACGGWKRRNPIPPAQASWDVYSKLHHDNLRYLRGLLEEAALPRPERTPIERQIGDAYAACMDEPAIERAGATPLRPLLAEIAALKSARAMSPLLARQQLQSGWREVGFGLGADQDLGDSSSVIGFLMAGGLGLPDRDYYLKDDARSIEIRAKYRAHVEAMLTLAGDPAKVARRAADDVLALETMLARASLTRVERRDPRNLHHVMTRAQIAELAPALDWPAYLAAAGLSAVDRWNVTEPAFFRELSARLAATPLPAWKAYLRWSVVNAQAEYLPRRFVAEDFAFYRGVLRGVKADRPRWERCVRLVDRDLGEALGQVFVARTFGPAVQQRTAAMVAEIERAMQAELEALPWMGPATRQQALEKLHSVVNKIGAPARCRDYSGLVIRRDDLHGNARRGLEFEARRVLAKIGKPVDRGEWQMTPPTVNAYYNAQMNDINFPAGVLQPPLFDPRMDDAPNYGNTGATIGHELTHGFDDEGRHFDARGNLRDWWTASDAAEFERRAACVADQYAEYPVVDGIKINSKLTLGEDVADLGGTWLAWLAWKHATAGQRLAPADGLSPDQRFFVGMAQWACSNERDENRRLNAVTNPHSPPEWRINGVVANLPGFAAAFQCRPGQPMVRATPCKIW